MNQTGELAIPAKIFGDKNL